MSENIGENAPSVVKIGVIGVGGGGGNAVSMMYEEKNSQDSVFNEIKIIAANTDVQALEKIGADERLQLGPALTKGQGAGGVPEIGKAAACESEVAIATAVSGCDMIFITAGMGGGTGTGAAPVVAKVSKDSDCLTVGVVTKPFNFEGKKKMKYANRGIEELRQNVDTLLVIPNERLIDIASETDSTIDMFKKPNEILIYAVKNISELISKPSYVNVDFADVKETMKDMGLAVIAFGSATGDNAALTAVKDALNNPLLQNYTIKGSKKMLVNFRGAKTSMREFNDACVYLNEQIDDDANFIWGATETESDKISALIVAEAINSDDMQSSLLDKQTKRVEASDQSTLFDIISVGEEVENLEEESELLDEESENGSFEKNEEIDVNEENLSPAAFDDYDFYSIPTDFDVENKEIPACIRKEKRRRSANDI